MYPFARLIWGQFRARSLAPLGPFDPHVSQHICWPWDIDPWMELNNGRTLTLYDLGRLPWGARVGANRALLANGWGMAVAGASVRYRKRVKAFDRITMVTRLAGWDARFFYMDQSMWTGDDCTSQALIRSAVTSGAGKGGIIAPARMAAAMGHDGPSPTLPDWIQAWAEADSHRPWPPEAGTFRAS